MRKATKEARVRLTLCQLPLLCRYVATEFSRNLALTLAAFVSIYLLIDFFEKIDRLLRAQIGIATIIEYFAAKLPVATAQVLPAAIVLAVIITFGLLARHHETVAIKCAGINLVRLLYPILGISSALAILLLILYLAVTPRLMQKINTIWETKVDKKPVRELIELKYIWYKGDRVILNIADFRKDTKTMGDVRIYVFDPHFHLIQLVAARKAQWTGKNWLFFDGQVQSFGARGALISETFKTRTIVLTERPEDFANLERKITEMTGADLHRFILRLERDGYDSRPYWAELHSRIAMAVTPFIVTLIGGALIFWREESNIPVSIAAGIVLIFLYWLLFSFLLSLGQVGVLPILAAAWLANISFGLAGILALSKMAR
ncbi:MAG: LptF/LptG family permease [Desulfobacca sp.]|uniref:LptF/LptG family permease n=1 Tax=Desulfobacca sp. TaxID=2067990 RepID=UPI004049EF96